MNASPPLIRTFRAPDARAALNAVKAAFGLDAVILETKQVGGGLFGRPHIEVTAAAGAPAEAPKAPQAPQPRGYGRAASSPSSSSRSSSSSSSSSPSSPSSAATSDRNLETEVAALRRVVDDMRGDLRRSGTSGALGGSGASGARLPDRAADRAWPQGEAEPELGPAARKAFRHLYDRGVDEVLARNLVDDAQTSGATRLPDILQAIAARAARQLSAAPCPWSAEGRRTVALIGPTGVGKTTAIAKIAARALLETRFKVGLITVDTYRVGASDQLARYGKIMGLGTYVARDKAGLLQAIDRCRDADLILIDTAGRSDVGSLAAQIDLVKGAPGVQLHLTMSAATGARELGAVARRYRGFGIERLIFTKLDEADGPGAALAATSVVTRPVSCVCDGQRVPEDIHAVTDGDLMKRFLDITLTAANEGEGRRGPG